MQDTSIRDVWWQGAKAIAPFAVGAIPFGLISGIAAVKAGLSLPLALFMSLGVFAGAAQLAAVQLIGSGAAAGVVVLTAIVINLRMLMYSASIAPHVQRASMRFKAVLSYMLTDQAYAVSILRFGSDLPSHLKPWFLFGAAAPMWMVWQLSTLVGILVGVGVPPAWSLDFAIPLAFIVLVVPAIRSRPALGAALSAAVVAVAAYPLPLNLGLLLATLVGIMVGVGLEALQKEQS